jgi:MFS family permease
LASRLPREAKLFGAVSLFNDFASEMVYPLLPALLTGLGAGPVALGALDGAADFASSVVKVGAGRLADHPRRRGPLVVIGYLVAVVVRPVIALATAAMQVITLRVVDRLGKGLRGPARDALIADATPLPLRGRAFGLQRSLDHAGAVLGPLAAWALLASGTLDVPGVIMASIVPGVLVLALTLLAVRGASGAARATPAPPVSPRGSLQLPVPVALVAASHVVRLPDALLLLHVQRLGVPVAAVTLLWAAVHVAKSLASFRGGSLSDRFGPGRVLSFAWLAYAALAGGLAFAHAPWHGWALFMGLSALVGLTEGPERALVAQLGAGRSGSAFGAYYGAQGVAALAGGLGLGLLYQVAGAAAACLTCVAGLLALRAAWRPIAS